eukprot:2805993-Alexandrium_andersonii.AAC.1
MRRARCDMPRIKQHACTPPIPCIVLCRSRGTRARNFDVHQAVVGHDAEYLRAERQARARSVDANRALCGSKEEACKVQH